MFGKLMSPVKYSLVSLIRLKGRTDSMRLGSPVFFSMLLSLLAESALASGIYKWVDAQGVTHFSATPPAASNSGQPRQVEELKPIIPADDDRSANTGIRGSWWGVVDGHTTQLHLKYDEFALTRSQSYASGNYDLHRYAEGKYRFHDNHLELDFFTHALAPGKIDSVERYEVLYQDGQQLHLLRNHIEKLVFKRFASGSPSQMARDLRGSWRDTKSAGIRYEFAPGTLTLYRESQYGGLVKRRIATWEWEDPELWIDHVADFVKPLSPTAAHQERWSLQDRSANRMRWLNTATGQILELERTR